MVVRMFKEANDFKNKQIILNILSTRNFCGAENVVAQQIKMFENDANYKMVYCSPSGPIEDRLKLLGIEDYIPIKKLTYKEVKKVVKIVKPEIIQAHDLRASMVASKFKKVKKISFMHVNNPSMKKLSLRSIITKFTLSKFDKVVWVSSSCFRDYKYKRFVDDKSIVLPNIVNIAEIQRKASNIEKVESDIIYCGRLSEQKNPLRMIRIIHAIVNIIPTLKAVIVGNGSLYEELNEYIRLNELCNNVALVGYVDNPINYIAGAKVMIMTSIFEGTPMVALEAMSLGVPVVSNPVDGLSDLIKNGMNGYIFNSDSDAVKILVDIITNSQKQKELSEQTITFAENYNKVEKYKQQLLNIYTEVL